MNARIALALLALVAAAPLCAQTKGQIRLPELAALADKASETVNVTIGPELLGFATKFLDPTNPDEAAAKKLVNGLSGVYVRNFTFETDFAFPKAEIDSVRRQLAAPGWNRIVEAKSKKENTDVEVYMLVENGRALGLAIIAVEPRELTLVNIVGNIHLDQLHDLERIGVPNLDIEAPNKPAPKAAPKAAPPKATPKTN